MIKLLNQSQQGIFPDLNTVKIISMMMIITAGTMLMMWIGELISEEHIGNGISLLTFEKMNLSEANKQFISDVLKKEWSGDIELPFEIQEYVKNNKEIFPEEKFRSIISVE